MTGSIQLKRGIWQAVICYQDETGKKKYKWISTGLPERGNKKAAKEILAQELEKFEKELTESQNKIERRSKPREVDRSMALMPFSDYCKQYLESIKDNISPTAYVRYGKHLKRIKDYFDKQKLRLIDITEEEIEDFYDYLKKDKLKNKTIKHYACITRPALREAYKSKLIPDNPYDFVHSLKSEKAILKFFDKNEMVKLFDALNGNKLELAVKMLACYGLRRSELLGLRWSAVDFEHKIISVNHKLIVIEKEIILSDVLKTETSRRTLPLIPAIETYLRDKKEEIEENRKFYGNTYNTEYLDYIFVNEKGRILFPNSLSAAFDKFLKANKLKDIRLHDLRHSCASIMLANGVQMKQIQEWLGHSNFSTTADIYSHLDFSSKIQSGNAISNALYLESNTENKSSLHKTLQKEMFENMLKEMRELGIDDVEKYFDYLEKQSKNITKSSNGYQM